MSRKTGRKPKRKARTRTFIPPKSDIAFKELMRCEEVRRRFISDVLGIPLEEIKSVRLENTFLSRRSRKEKQCILDVRILLNDNSKINVELQVRRLAYWDKRSLFYLSKMYTEDLFNGQRYDRLKKCIVISILDFSGDENPGYHKVYHLRDQEGRLYSDQFEVHVIELDKELTGSRLDDWIRLFRVESEEELEEMQSGNAGVMRAVEEVRTMNLRKMVRTLYEARLKAKRDQWAMEEAMKEDSMAAGLAEGRAQGMAEGRAQGVAQGMVQGELHRSRQAVLDLLGDFGEIPEDIRSSVAAEENAEVLRRWLKFAARVENFEDFRNRISQDDER